MRVLLCSFLVCVVCSIAIQAQTPPTTTTTTGTIKAGGVRSRNMELVDVIPFRIGGGDQFEVQSVPYGDHSSSKQVIITGWGDEISPGNKIQYVRIIDVTNPRTPNSHFMKIRVRTSTTPILLNTCLCLRK